MQRPTYCKHCSKFVSKDEKEAANRAKGTSTLTLQPLLIHPSHTGTIYHATPVQLTTVHTPPQNPQHYCLTHRSDTPSLTFRCLLPKQAPKEACRNAAISTMHLHLSDVLSFHIVPKFVNSPGPASAIVHDFTHRNT
jgi:hypothetical protein